VDELRRMRLGTVGTDFGKLKWGLRMMRLRDSEYRRLIALIADISKTRPLHPSLPKIRERKDHLHNLVSSRWNSKFEKSQVDFKLTDDDKQFLRVLKRGSKLPPITCRSLLLFRRGLGVVKRKKTLTMRMHELMRWGKLFTVTSRFALPTYVYTVEGGSGPLRANACVIVAPISVRI
jgi:hypothetical protein